MDPYYLTPREKKLDKIILNKKTVKKTNFRETICLRLLISAAFFIEKLVNQYWIVVENIFSFLTFSELAALAAVMREIGCPNFFAYLKRQQGSRKLLTCIFFNKNSNNDLKLIINYQKMQLIPESLQTICVKKSNCIIFLHQIITNERQLLNFTRCLKPVSIAEPFDALDLGYLGTEHEENLIAFNPIYELGVYITCSFTWVFSYGGKARESVGQIIHRFTKTNMAKHLSVSWSPDGLHMLLLTRNNKNVQGEVLVFRYLSAAGIMRKIKITPNIQYDSHHCSSKLWCGPTTFMLLTTAQELIKYEIANTRLHVTTLFENFTSNIFGPDSYTQTNENDKLQFGSFTCCPSDESLIALLRPCVNKHAHDQIALIRIAFNQLIPLIILSAPGFILEFEFYKTSKQLWIMWKENPSELWPSVNFHTCKITLPSNCPYVSEKPILPHYELTNYIAWGSSRIGLGHYDLIENLFSELISLRSYQNYEIKFTSDEFEKFSTYSKKKENYWQRSELTAFSHRMQLTDHFVSLILLNETGVRTTYRVSLIKYDIFTSTIFSYFQLLKLY
jgi:hypothetical protein